MPESFEAWWSGLGPVTKFSLITSVLCTCGFSFQMVSPQLLLIDFDAMIWQLQIWRPITATFFLGKFGFPWLMAIAMLVTYVQRHEEDFKGRLAELIWMFTLIIVFLHICAFVLDMMLVSFSFIMALCWIWCKRNPTATLSIYMFTFGANMFPWAFMLFHLVMGMSIVDDIVGVVAGHGYLFLADMLPRTHGYNLVRTPQFLYNWFPNQRVTSYGVTAAPEGRRMAGQAEQRHAWGRGNALGN